MGMFGRLRGIHRSLFSAAAISALVFCVSGCAGLVESQTKPSDPAGAPAISGVTTTQVSSTGAMISWATDQAASSQVDYGTTTSYGSSSALNTTMVSSHSVGLSSLKASTLYHYRVESTNSAGSLGTSGDFTFTTASGTDTTPPKVSITSPVSGATVSGTITVSATATDNVGVASVQFLVDNVDTGAADTSAPFSLSLDTTKLSNGTHSLTATASDAAGNRATSTAVSITVSNATLPVITSQPTNKTVTAGQTATFSVAATGTAPLTYQWKKDGASIAGATASGYTTPGTTTADNGSTFEVVVSNSAGSTPSTTVTLTVNAAAVAPTITTEPISQTVTAGQTATFSVAATGTAPLTYQWKKNGSNIAGAMASSYTTPATTSADNGSTFQVVVTNSAGSTPSTTVTLTVNAAAVAPTITTQPTNQTVTAGQTATFSVSATGTAPLTYQWKENGANIPGATSSSYTTAATTSADNGSTFQVVVSNATGNTPSTTVTLTVNASGGGSAVAALVQHVSSSNTRNNSFSSPYCYHFQLPN
ncbi:MAG: immunoglobulin domain-containing protein, partial [Candidatus Acidiferrum sp.]